MKKTVLVFILLTTCINGFAENEQILFSDSLTGAQIAFPANAVLKLSEKAGFYKCTATLPNSLVSVYSMKNIDGEPYSWVVINKFDDNDKYGTFINTEKIEGLDVEGWRRYYDQQDKYGKKYINCVTALRGKDYAIYLLESAYKKEDLQSAAIVEASTYAGSTKSERAIQQYKDIWLAITIIAFVLPFLLYPVRKKLSDPVKLTLGIVFSVLAIVSAWLFTTSIWAIVIALLIYPAVWYCILTAENWTDVYNNVIKNILDNI